MITLRLVIFLILTSVWITTSAAEATLAVTIDEKVHRYSAETLLARPDVVTIQIEHDVSYGRQMTYRAIPLAAIFGKQVANENMFWEVKALDGFVSELPGELVLNKNSSKAVAMLAIEDPDNRWPSLPGKAASAGPFYLVWIGANTSSIRSEQWPYQIASITQEAPPETRWPQLAVDSSFAKNDPLRQGQHLFIVQCLVCHKFGGAGNAEVGPDLNHPMNPTQYFTLQALKKFIRDPASVRNWPERKMPAFKPDTLSDKDIDHIIQYLRYQASKHVNVKQ